MEIKNYTVDSVNQMIRCKEESLDCVDLAIRIEQISNKSFGFFQWLYFYAIDILSYLSYSFKERQFGEASQLCKIVLDSQKNHLRLQEKIDRYVRDHFHVISSNVEHINDAEVICLGETHGTFSHMYRNAQLIDAISEKQDLLLVEHDDNLSFRSDQAKYLRKQLPLKGWDKLDADTIEELSLAMQMDPIDLIGLIFFGEFPIDREEQINWANQKIIDDLPGRNSHMCKTIEENRKPGRRIYVIGGKGHFTPPQNLSENGLDFTPQNEAYKQTLSYLKTKKYAVMIPKTEKLKISWTTVA